MAISKRTRFEVFKRDGFACQYCGKTPPAVTLEIDHVVPLHPADAAVLGGSDAAENLVTSCLECNRGKSNVSLGQVRPDVAEKRALLEEREEQLREYSALLKRKERRLVREEAAVDAVFQEAFPGYGLTEKFRKGTVRMFLSRLPKPEVVDAMRLAVDRVRDRDRCIRYFCGICWNKVGRE